MRTSRIPKVVLSFAAVLLGSVAVFGTGLIPNPLLTPDSTGVLSTFSTSAGIDINNPFFQNLGSNGRTCNTCHISSSAWAITPADVQAKFNATQGIEPIFRTNDGSNCPSAGVSTLKARRVAYS
jgi:cytochrome c peroxidase